MSKPTLDSIATAKAKLAEELKKLEQQEATLLEESFKCVLASIRSAEPLWPAFYR